MADKGKEVQGTQQGQVSHPARFSSPFDEMQRWFDDVFANRFMRPVGMGRSLFPEMAELEARIPRVDVIDRENELLVRAELPGVDKKDVDITVNEGMATIKAIRSHEEKEERGDYYRCEISRGTFARTVALPANVDADRAKAHFKDGILELTLPKLEAAKRRRITVQ